MSRILFLPRWYPDEHDMQNGVFIRKHARAAALANEVVVLYAHPAKEQKRVVERIEGNLTEIIIYYKSSFFPPVNILLYIAALFKGWKKIKSAGFFPDLCHVNVLNRPALLALWLRWRHDVPFLISEHWSGYLTGGFQQRNLLSGLFTAYAIRRAAMVIVVSETLKAGMLQCGLEADYRILPNVVEVLPQAIAQKPASATFRYLVVADLREKIKNISGIIRAFGSVYAGDRQTELVIAGDGPDRKELEALAGKELLPVSFMGRFSNEEVLKIIPTAHALVINSRVETFSIVALEAIFSGRPVIATRCGGPEQFINEQNGIVIEKDNDAQLIEAMTRMKDNYGSYPEEIVKNSIPNQYTLEAIATRLNGYYDTAMHH